ncbi:hypothetical protein BBP40_008691 [Aspergillus hancockii]|nr:hypothetical protein BBP40_008691 [Aspergillus hancockii]
MRIPAFHLSHPLSHFEPAIDPASFWVPYQSRGFPCCDNSTTFHNTPHLAYRSDGIGNMLQHLMYMNNIEGIIRELESVNIRGHTRCPGVWTSELCEELERQLERETLQAYIRQVVEAQTAQQRAREHQYEARTMALEKAVQQLQQTQATQAASSTGPMPSAAQKDAQTTLSQGPQGPRDPQDRQAECSTHRPHGRAAYRTARPSRSEPTY